MSPSQHKSWCTGLPHMAPPRMPIGTRLVLTIYNAKFTFLNKKRGGGGRYTVVLILCDEKFLF